MARYSLIASGSVVVLTLSMQGTVLSAGVHAGDTTSAATLAATAPGATAGEQAVSAAAATTTIAKTATSRQGRILFTRGREVSNGTVAYLFSAAPDGSHQRRLTWHHNSWGARWSPDGRRIAYTHSKSGYWYDPAGSGSVWMMRANGSHKHRVLADATMEAWSAGGRQLLVSRYDPSQDEYFIAILRLADRRLRQYKAQSYEDYIGADWSWRTNRIVFGAGISEETNPDLYTMNPDFSDVTRLTHTTAGKGEETPRWAPAGRRRVAYTFYNYGSPPLCGFGVAVLRLADHSRRVIRRCAEQPVWSPGGSQLLLSKFGGETSRQADLVKVNLSTGKATTVVRRTARLQTVTGDDWRS